MKRLARTLALLALMSFWGGSVANAQVSIGIQIGPPPPPPVVYAPPPPPARDFVWVEGYWYPTGNHYKWHEGYWTRAPYPGARWIAPRYYGGQFYVGYWDGDHGRVDHDHRWDHDKDRDDHHHKGHKDRN